MDPLCDYALNSVSFAWELTSSTNSRNSNAWSLTPTYLRGERHTCQRISLREERKPDARSVQILYNEWHLSARLIAQSSETQEYAVRLKSFEQFLVVLWKGLQKKALREVETATNRIG